MLLFNLASTSKMNHENLDEDSTVAYIKGSLPNQIYRCIQRFNLLRCLKYFVLLRLESNDVNFEPTNSTKAFLGNILQNVNNLPKEIPERITKLNDEELDERLTEGFQTFFKNRPIKLHFIPNVLVKVIPSTSNDLEISFKRAGMKLFTGREMKKDTKDEDIDTEENEDDEDEDDEENDLDYDYGEKDDKVSDKKEEAVKDGTNGDKGDIKHDDKEDEKSGMRRKQNVLHVGLPLLIAPYMIFAGFLPMLIPVLKLATAFTTIVNVTALVASIIYLTRQHALEREMQQTVYFNPGYKERK
jgi:hypothetical protein